MENEMMNNMDAMTENLTDAMPEDAKKQVMDRIAMKRLGDVKDVAETVAFLASDKASYITGQVICIDGGMSV